MKPPRVRYPKDLTGGWADSPYYLEVYHSLRGAFKRGFLAGWEKGRNGK